MDELAETTNAIPSAPIAPVVNEEQLKRQVEAEEAMAKRNAIVTSAGSWRPVAATFSDQQRLAKMYKDSKVLPERFNTEAMIITALHFASEHFPGKEMTALRSIAVINGTPCMFGDLPLAMVQRSPEFAMIDESFNPPDGDLTQDTFQAVCKVTRVKAQGHELIVTRTFSITDAKRAGLWDKKSQTGKPSPWILYPKRMLQMRARSWALKDCFADVLMGIGIVEYDHNGDPDQRDVSPVVNSLNGLIKGESNVAGVQ